jgi:hypothetical protein
MHADTRVKGYMRLYAKMRLIASAAKWLTLNNDTLISEIHLTGITYSHL